METYRLLQIAIGTVILRERRKRGLTQQVLADQAHLQRCYIVSIEQGKRSISLAILFSVADALHITPTELFKKIYDEWSKK